MKKLITALAVAVAMIACMMVLSCKAVWADSPEETPETQEPTAAEVSVPAPDVEPVPSSEPATVSESVASTEPGSISEPASGTVPASNDDAVSGDESASGDAVVSDTESAASETSAAVQATAANEDRSTVQASQPKAASADGASDNDAAQADGGDSDKETVIDIRNKAVENITINNSTGILTWDALEGAVSYFVNIMYDKSDGSGGVGLGAKTTGNSIDLYSNKTFAGLLKNVGAADYKFIVSAYGQTFSDGTANNSKDGRLAQDDFEPNQNLFYYDVRITIYTNSFSYITKSGTFEEGSRGHYLHKEGGEVLLNGKSVTTDKENGQIIYLFAGQEEFKNGQKVAVSYNAADTYEFSSMTIDGQSYTGSQTITIQGKDIDIVVYFRQPLSAIIANGFTVSSDNFDDAAQDILKSDMSLVKRWGEGYVRMRIDQVSADSLSDKDRNVSSSDSYLKSSKIKSGAFFNLGLYKSLNMGDLTQVAKSPKSVNIRITIPDALKSTKNNIRRVFYLIRVDNGNASVIADATGDTLSAYVTDSGLYMLGYRDTDMTGILSSGGIVSYAAPEEPEPELELMVPEIELADTTPIISTGEEIPAESSVPAAAVAAAGAAAVAAGAYALSKLLPVIAASGVK